jgi:DNA-binding NarL/FixJ family response regulator
VRVLVVDDHPAFRKALASALSLVDDIEVAGEAAGGEDACIEVQEVQPDVVLMDLSMPDISGIEAMQRIHATTPELPVVILTAHADEGVERAARGAGASGFVAKGRGLQDILVALQEVAG